MKQLHPSNCLGIRSYADAQGCYDLQRAAHAYTMVCTRLLHISTSCTYRVATWKRMKHDKIMMSIQVDSQWYLMYLEHCPLFLSQLSFSTSVTLPPLRFFGHLPALMLFWVTNWFIVHKAPHTITATMAVFSSGLLWWQWNSSFIDLIILFLALSLLSFYVPFPSTSLPLCAVSVKVTVPLFLFLSKWIILKL